MISKKLKISFFFIVFLFTLIVSKAFYIQVLNKDKLIKYSNSQFLRKTEIHPRRGVIYDRNNNPLAINIDTYSIFAIPKENDLLKSNLKELDKILGRDDFKKNLNKVTKRKKFTWLYRNLKLNEEQVESIKELKEIFFENTPKRFYPNHELLSQTLGFVGIDNKGLSGVEYQFNKELQGEKQVIKYYRDAKGRPVKVKSVDQGKAPKDIVLSIDKEVQALVEKHLKDTVLKHDAEKGGVIVMNPENGEIIAMANYPTFDPNKIKSSNANLRKLPIITDPFEPGSTFKVLTVLSALENNIVRPDTNYYCEEGKLKVENHYISEAESKKKFEWLSVEDILKYSSNVGTTKIAFDLTYPRLKKTIDSYHFGNKTGIELPGESRGIYRNDAENVGALELSNLSFGQGIATTALQMVTFYASLANGGYLVEPTIIKDKKPIKTKVATKESIEKINEILVKAVEDGTGSNAKLDYVKIAGKTSTAQKAVDGRYSSYIGGFIGYPINTSTKFVIYTYIDSPKKGGYYGNIVAGPLFKNIAQFILFKNKEFGNLANHSEDEKKINFDKLEIKQSSIDRSFKKGFMPDFVGLDKKSAKLLAKKAQLEINFIGFGVVTKQFPEKGAGVNSNEQVKLYFSPPDYE